MITKSNSTNAAALDDKPDNAVQTGFFAACDPTLLTARLLVQLSDLPSSGTPTWSSDVY